MKHKMFSRILIVLVFAVLLLGFFLADTLVKYSKGGEAADPLLLVISILILGGGIAVIGVLMWREWRRLRQQRDYFDEE